MTARQCFRLTASGLSIWSPSPCFEVCCEWKGVIACCRSCANSTLLLPVIFGKTNTASSMTSLMGSGEQGDALMPALFSLGQHPALKAVQSQLLEGETLCAFFDDLCAICKPNRAVPIFNLIQRELWTYSRVEVQMGKTQIWNRSGFEPFGFHLLTAAARRVDPAAVVWRGDTTLPAASEA